MLRPLRYWRLTVLTRLAYSKSIWLRRPFRRGEKLCFSSVQWHGQTQFFVSVFYTACTYILTIRNAVQNWVVVKFAMTYYFLYCND